MRLQFKSMYPSLSAQERPTTKALQQIRCVISGLGFSFIVSLLAGGNALAANFNFTKVVDNNTPIPGGRGNFNTFYAPSLDNKSVAFFGLGNSNGGLFPQQGVYATVDGSLEVIADRTTPIPNGKGNFQFFSDPTLDNGSVAFIGSASLGTGEVLTQQGVYTNVGGSLNVVADWNTPIPNGKRNFGFFSGNGLTLDNGSVAFGGSTGSVFPEGVYTNLGGSLSVIADGNTLIPGGTGNFTSFGVAPTFDNGSVAFSGSRNVSLEPSQSGIYTNVGGSLSVIADRNTLIPGGTGNFTSLSEPIIDNGNVAFFGSRNVSLEPSQLGIYTNVGGSLSVIADRNTPIPNGTGNFTSFGRLSFNKGNIAFVNPVYVSPNGSSFQGIYTTLGGELTKVIDTNDSLFGKTINSFSFGREGLSGNQIAFAVTFSDRSQGIYIATLDSTSVPESSTALGVLAIGAMFAPSILLKYKKSN